MTAWVGTAELMRFIGIDSATNPFSDTQLSEAITRAQKEIEDFTAGVWVDGTGTTPAYGQATDEKHSGRGRNDRLYFTRRYPLPDVSTTISGTAVAVDDTTIYVDSAKYFPESGVIGVENDKITYTGKTATTFTGCTGIVSAHGTAVDVKPYVVEISNTDEGSTPTFIVASEDNEFDIDLESGRIYLYKNIYSTDIYGGSYPPKSPNRVRVSYLYGYSEIPADLCKLCLMIASRELMRTTVRKATAMGMNNFNPSLIEVDSADIMAELEKNKLRRMSNI
jgi:hypothetical protein